MFVEVTCGLLAVFISSFILLYRFTTRHFDRFQKEGIPYEKGYFPYGSYNIFSRKKHLNDHIRDSFFKFKDERYSGWFLRDLPVYAVRDVDIIKQILVKDFNNFVDRNKFTEMLERGGSYDKLWSCMLVMARGNEWKQLRATFSPVFSSARMKMMLHFVKQTADSLIMELEKKAEEDVEINLMEILGKFTLDALALSTFSICANSFENTSSVFAKYAHNIFKTSKMEKFVNLMKYVSIKYVPGVAWLLETLDVNFIKKKETKFFYDLIVQTLRARKESQIRRNDIIDLMLDCVNEEVETANDFEQGDGCQHTTDAKFTPAQRKSKEVDERSIVATAMIFLIAGYDTTANTLSCLFYNMAKHPHIQKNLQREVDEAFEAAGGKFPDYNTIFSLPYLDMVIHETLRHHSAVGMITRMCVQDCKLPGTDVMLKKGDMISISVAGIHKDPHHYSHPNEFYPEHFSKEEKAARSPYAFQGFGQGPRSCIGMRFALLEAKVAVLAVIKHFSFLPGIKTLEPLELDLTTTLTWAKGDLWARITRRDTTIETTFE